MAMREFLARQQPTGGLKSMIMFLAWFMLVLTEFHLDDLSELSHMALP